VFAFVNKSTMQNLPKQPTADNYPPPRWRGGPTEGIQKGPHSTCRLASLLQWSTTPDFKHVLAGKEDWYSGLFIYWLVVNKTVLFFHGSRTARRADISAQHRNVLAHRLVQDVADVHSRQTCDQQHHF